MAQDTAQDNTSTKSTAAKSPAAPKTGAPLPTDAGSAGMGSIGGFVEDNAKIFVAMGVIAALGAIGYLSFDFLKGRQEKAAQEAFYSVEMKFSKVKEEMDRAKFQKLMPEAAEKDAKPAKESSGNLEQDYGTLIADLEKVAREHVGTADGTQAALLAGETYLAYNQPEKAAQLSEQASKGLGPDKLLGGLARMQWGNAVAAKGDCKAAVEIWQQVIGAEKAAFLHPDASLRAGVCLETLGQNDKAMEMYRKASAGGERSATARTAKSFLRALEIKAKANQG